MTLNVWTEWDTYKNEDREEGEDVTEPAHVLSSWPRVPGHLYSECFKTEYLFEKLPSGHSLLTLFTDSPINVTVGSWQSGI